MPTTRARKQTRRLGPYDLSTVQLTGGSELAALSEGFNGLRFKKDGYNEAATLANKYTLFDATAQQPWILADVKTGLLRSQNAPQLFAGPYKTEMENIFTHPNSTSPITADQFSRGNAWKAKFKLSKNAPLTGPLSDIGQHYVRLSGDVLIHHRPALTALAPAFVPPPPPVVTPSPAPAPAPAPKGKPSRTRKITKLGAFSTTP